MGKIVLFLPVLVCQSSSNTQSLQLNLQIYYHTLRERYESYLQVLEKQREQLYVLIHSAHNDPKADKDEIDRYLDLLNDVNRVAETVKRVLQNLDKQ